MNPKGPNMRRMQTRKGRLGKTFCHYRTFLESKHTVNTVNIVGKVRAHVCTRDGFAFTPRPIRVWILPAPTLSEALSPLDLLECFTTRYSADSHFQGHEKGRVGNDASLVSRRADTEGDFTAFPILMQCLIHNKPIAAFGGSLFFFLSPRGKYTSDMD